MASLAQLGNPVPDFGLPDLSGIEHRPSQVLGRILILNFWSAECPWSERADRETAELLRSVGSDNLAWWSIASNANEPRELIGRVAAERQLPAVLLDTDLRLADAFGAATTPHFFVIDRQGVLRYCGAPDDVTFRQRTPRRAFLAEAVRSLLDGRLPDPAATAACGCALVRHGQGAGAPEGAS
jgi:peroxiredoxin